MARGWLGSRLGLRHAVEGLPVQRGPWAQRDRQLEVRPRLDGPAEPLQALAKRVVGVVGRRIEVEQLAEGASRAFVLAAVEVRPAEGLQDRLAVRLEPVRAFEDDGRLGVMTAAQQL